jgi:hypothetical protein
MNQEDMLREELTEACQLLQDWVDCQGGYSASLAVDSIMIVKRWQRGEFLKKESAPVNQKLAYDPSDPVMQWIVALAEGFKRAGRTHSPIVPDPEVIHRCIVNLQGPGAPPAGVEITSVWKGDSDASVVGYIRALEHLYFAALEYRGARAGNPTGQNEQEIIRTWERLTDQIALAATAKGKMTV